MKHPLSVLGASIATFAVTACTYVPTAGPYRRPTPDPIGKDYCDTVAGLVMADRAATRQNPGGRDALRVTGQASGDGIRSLRETAERGGVETPGTAGRAAATSTPALCVTSSTNSSCAV